MKGLSMNLTYASARAAIALTTIVFLSTGHSSICSAQSSDDLTGASAPANSIWLDSLDISRFQQDYGDSHAGKSSMDRPLTLNGIVYQHGVGTHANGKGQISLGGQAVKFEAYVGVDDERKTSTKASVQFIVKVDGQQVAESPVMHGGQAPVLLSTDLTGAKVLELDVTDAGDGIVDDHADWAGATIIMAAGSSYQTTTVDLDAAYNVPGRLNPEPTSLVPAINNPIVVGSTPGRPFMFLIPASGQAPLTFASRHLPSGLSLDKATGIITGSLKDARTYRVIVTVSNTLGKATKVITIVGGAHKLALTPPMGWNSWNVFAGNVDEGKVKDAAQVMIDQGLAQHGYEYVNIDDTWEAGRDPAGNILANTKFPDMKALADSVHVKGLHIGLYSSPGPTTCGNYTGSYQHEQQDATTYASWGFDYLKYDWCSYGNIANGDNSVAMDQKPYQVMRTALDNTDRDIVFSLCQYGSGDVWKWGADPTVGGNCWRTTGDIRDNWGSMHGILEQQDGHEIYAGPGHWNDPDMLVLGSVGWGSEHPTHLHPNEQLVHFSMWCMLSAPLLIGCDMTKLDDLTREILTNDEVIAIDQDPLGKPAGKIATYPNDGGEVWARPLADGSSAVGLFNPSDHDQSIAVPSLPALGLNAPYKVRDLWLHQDLGTQSGGYSTVVPAHGIVLLKVTAAGK
jgi:alpha-galactosidase